MKKICFFILLGGLFLSMTAFVQRPNLGFGMTDREMMQFALANTFNHPNYAIKGKVGAFGMMFNVVGAFKENEKYVTITSDFANQEDVLSYYQSGSQHIVTTPIKGYEKLVFDGHMVDKFEGFNSDFGQLFELLIKDVAFENNDSWRRAEDALISIYISKETLNDVIKSEELKAMITGQLSDEKDININLYIDSKCHIRSIDINVPLKTNILTGQFFIEQLDQKKSNND